MLECYVCEQEITGWTHTYHAEGCPRREPDCTVLSEDCHNLSGCGEDVHEECCPTCTGQAF